MNRFDEQGLTREEAVAALQDYAALLDDGKVPGDFDFGKRLSVLKAAIGKGPGSFKAQVTIPVSSAPDTNVVTSLALVRGVL